MECSQSDELIFPCSYSCSQEDCGNGYIADLDVTTTPEATVK